MHCRRCGDRLLFHEYKKKSLLKREEAGKRGILPALSMKKCFYVEKVFTLLTSITIPNECEKYLMKM